MALPKIASPQPAIFTSDPVEQIYAKGVLDPTNGGLAGMLLHAAKMGRSQDQDTYLGSLRDSNAMASRLAQFESMQDMMKERMKQSAELIKKGYTPSSTPDGSTLFTNTEDADAVARLIQDVIRSNAEKNRKAHMTGSGGGTKDSVTQELLLPGYANAQGTDAAQGTYKITSKSSNPVTGEAALETARREIAAKIMAQKGNITPQERAKMDERARQLSQRNIQPND